MSLRAVTVTRLKTHHHLSRICMRPQQALRLFPSLTRYNSHFLAFSHKLEKSSDASVGGEETLSESVASIINPNELEVLSEPPTVKKYPTPWFDVEDWKNYILPLYRRGWSLVFTRRVNPLGVRVISSCLVGTYKFSNFTNGTTFISRMAQIAEEQNHHPTFLSLSLSEDHKIPVLKMELETHSARRPNWVFALRDNASLIPGLTRRDIRLALALEDLYWNSFTPEEAFWPVRTLDQPDMETITYFFRHRVAGLPIPVCPKCHMKHTGLCREAENRLAPHCRKCGRRHQPMSRCPIQRRNRSPTTPCPNCGEDHWLADCRKPQLPPGEIENFLIKEKHV